MTVLRSRITVFACSLLLPLAACAPDTEEEAVPPAEEMQATPPAAPAELASAEQAYIAAWNGTDAAAVGDFFLEDATAMVGDSTFTGRADIMARWITTNVAAVSELTVTESLSEQRGEEWYTEGTYQHKMQAPDATEKTDATGRYMTNWVRTPEGQWKIRMAHVMPDAPAEAATPAPQN
jgi:ketosteroid isomerase-like protein